MLPLHSIICEHMAEFQIKQVSNLHLVTPVRNLGMAWLKVHADLIARHSRGAQKKVHFHNQPCITLREETEFLELVKTAWNAFIGVGSFTIAKTMFYPLAPNIALYCGDGDAAAKILAKILR
jgi:UDP-GlcNAc3NAcA epimerase